MAEASVTRAPHATPRRSPIGPATALSAALLMVCCLLATVGQVWSLPDATRFATYVLGAFLIWELRRIPRQQIVVGALLIGVGSLAAWPSGAIPEVLASAAKGTLIFVALFVAVGFLQFPALNSPSMHAARDVIVNQPPGRRYATLSISAHLFGALTNFAALSLLSTFLHGDLDRAPRERMACAMIRGFALAASWSPFFVSIAVILYVMPEVTWLEIAVPGLPLAAIMLVYGALFDRVRNPRPATPASEAATTPRPKLPSPVIARISFLAVVLVGSILFTAETLAVSTPIAIFLVVPPISAAWAWFLVRDGTPGGFPAMGHSIVENMVKLRAEIVMFLSANYLGYGAAKFIDPAVIATVLQDAGIVGGWAVFGLLGFMLFCTMSMIHPLVLIVLLGRIFPAEALGVHDVSLALCMALIWGVGTTSSPASGLTLFMTRVLDGSPFHVAWRLNGVYAVGGVLVGGTFISMVNAWWL